MQEIEDPELATKRTRALYKAKGYSDDWIEKRMRGIAIREELTDEWKKRNVRRKREYEILTAEIASAAFGVTPLNPTGRQRGSLATLVKDPELHRSQSVPSFGEFQRYTNHKHQAVIRGISRFSV